MQQPIQYSECFTLTMWDVKMLEQDIPDEENEVLP